MICYHRDTINRVDHETFDIEWPDMIDAGQYLSNVKVTMSIPFQKIAAETTTKLAQSNETSITSTTTNLSLAPEGHRVEKGATPPDRRRPAAF